MYVTDDYHNLFTRLGLIPTAQTAAGLVQLLNVTLRAEGYAIGGDAMTAAGVPVNGNQAFLTPRSLAAAQLLGASQWAPVRAVS